MGKKMPPKGWFFYRENSKTDSLSGWLAHLPIAYVDYIEIAFGHKKAKPIIDDLNHIGGKRIYFKQYFQHTNRCSTQEPAWLTPDVKAKRAKAQERIEANRAIADNYAKNYGPDFLATFRQDLKRKCNARSWFKYYDHTRTINKSGWHIVLPDLENSPHAKLGIYEGGKAMPLESTSNERRQSNAKAYSLKRPMLSNKYYTQYAETESNSRTIFDSSKIVHNPHHSRRNYDLFLSRVSFQGP